MTLRRGAYLRRLMTNIIGRRESMNLRFPCRSDRALVLLAVAVLASTLSAIAESHQKTIKSVSPSTISISSTSKYKLDFRHGQELI
jgi:hypothetical protein